jgi:hypothetical protein
MNARGRHSGRGRVLERPAPVAFRNLGELVVAEIGLCVHDCAERALADNRRTSPKAGSKLSDRLA